VRSNPQNDEREVKLLSARGYLWEIRGVMRSIEAAGRVLEAGILTLAAGVIQWRKEQRWCIVGGTRRWQCVSLAGGFISATGSEERQILCERNSFSVWHKTNWTRPKLRIKLELGHLYVKTADIVKFWMQSAQFMLKSVDRFFSSPQTVEFLPRLGTPSNTIDPSNTVDRSTITMMAWAMMEIPFDAAHLEASN